MADLYPDEWTSRRSLPRRSAEAWLWTDGDGGFLVAKYNQEHIEFSVADADYVKPRQASGNYANLQLAFLHSDRNLCLRFGGAGNQGVPGAHRHRALRPGQRIDFGASIIEVFDGDWQAGYSSYKGLPEGQGESVSPGTTTRKSTGTSSTGWVGAVAPTPHSRSCPIVALQEAQHAQPAGAQRFYFDPGWDLFEGSAVWDVERLGPVEEFIGKLRADYDLELALHLMMHTKSLEENPAIYRPESGWQYRSVGRRHPLCRRVRLPGVARLGTPEDRPAANARFRRCLVLYVRFSFLPTGWPGARRLRAQRRRELLSPRSAGTVSR